MKKKIINALELVMLIITLIPLNIKCIEVYNYTEMLILHSTPDTTFMSIFELCKPDANMYIMLLFYAVIAMMCIVSIVTKSEYREGVIHTIIPIIWCIIVISNLVIYTSADRPHGEWQVVSYEQFPTPPFLICAIAVVIIGFVKRASFITAQHQK